MTRTNASKSAHPGKALAGLTGSGKLREGDPLRAVGAACGCYAPQGNANGQHRQRRCCDRGDWQGSIHAALVSIVRERPRRWGNRAGGIPFEDHCRQHFGPRGVFAGRACQFGSRSSTDAIVSCRVSPGKARVPCEQLV